MKFRPAMLIGLIAALLAAVALPTLAQDPREPRAGEIQTVCVRGKGQPEITDKINSMHAEMAAKGFRFAAMSPYAERGDLAGMFVTYVR